MSKTYCPLPWIFQAVRNNGDIRVCCQANVSKSQGLLKKEDGTIYNASSDDLIEARNSPTLKKIRLDMLRGKHPEACVRCQKEESMNIRSRRQYEKQNWEHLHSFKKAKAETSKDGSIVPSKSPSVYYDLRFGNRCNLKCRMCGPTDSDLWYADYVKIWDVHSFSDSHGEVHLIQNKNGAYKTKNQDYDWVDSPTFWDGIKKNTSHIRHIHTVGGEPLLINKHYELLESIIKFGNPKKVTIEYNSNITVLPTKALKLWEAFKNVKIGMSIDSYGSLNDYIRYPSCFKKIEKNMEQLDRLPSQNLDLWIAVTVNVYNIFHLPEFIKWKLKKGFLNINALSSSQPIFTSHLLHTPQHLNIKILPTDYKLQIQNKFDYFLKTFKSWLEENNFSQKQSEILYRESQYILQGYVRYMNSEDWSDLIPKFWKYTYALDQIRKEKLQDVTPELYDSISQQINSNQ